MPIFTQSLQIKESDTEQEARKKMVNHIRYIQEQLEYTLLNLDSGNINEIDIDKTTITDSDGNSPIGSLINLPGANRESFTVGKNANGQFVFALDGNGGTQVMYLNSSGELIIKGHRYLTVDGGEW